MFDSETKIQRVKNSFTEITGYQPQDVVGKTIRVLKSGKHDRSFYDAMWSAIRKNGYWQGEI
ncbi:MAG: PAS domain S-box protein [Methylococcaceae bacterium]|nr:PAS domain S-box protein [Methylococcaceae bacterium]